MPGTAPDISTLAIRHEATGDRGAYTIALPDGSVADMTYIRRTNGVMAIDHTGVPPHYEGRGIALRLVKAAIADARREGFTIDPICPYVAVQFRRHPDWADLHA